jgi:hypothetical protein
VVLVGGALVLTGGDDSDEDTSAPAADTSETEAPADDGEGATDEPAAEDDSAPAPATDPSATPQATVEAFFAAARSGDCQGMIDLMAPEAFAPDETPADAVTECQADAEGRASIAELEVVDIAPVSETGDTAVVAVTATLDGETNTQELPLRSVDGSWRIVAFE